MIRILLFCLFHVFIFGIKAQTDIAIGEWKALIPYNTGTYIAESPDRIFYVSDKALVRVNKPFEQPTLITTIEGLSDMDPNFILYNEDVNGLLVTYENSNIDIIYEDEVVNVNDILRSTNIQGDKTIMGVEQNEDRAFISAGFGIVVVDLENALILKSTNTPESVLDFCVFEDNYYALSDGKIYRLPLSDYNQFEFWQVWSEWEPPVALPENITQIEVFRNQLYITTEQELYRWSIADSLDRLNEFDSSQEIQFIQKGINYLMCGVLDNDGNDRVLFYTSDALAFENNSCHGSVSHAWESKEGVFYFGDRFGGLRFSFDGLFCETRFFECPDFETSSDLDFSNGKLAIAGGGPSSSFAYGFSSNGFYVYEAPEWDNYNPQITPAMQDPDIYDVFRVAIHPETGLVNAGTYWGGLLQLDGDEISILDATNSCLQGAVGDSQRERISGLAFDQQNQLWISNYLAPEGLKVLRNDGSCESFNIPTSSTLADLVCDEFDQVWARVQGSDAGLLVFNEGDPTTNADDRFKIYNSGNSALPNNEVTALCADRSGNVWVGTIDGLILFACGNAVFEFDCSTQPVVDDDGDGIGDFLLDDVKINAVIADGANRKWVGTDGGLIVLSPSGNEELFSFTTQNSPLFSNQITALSQDRERGIIYIGTTEGVMAYRSQAIKAERFNSADIYAYPNPVRPDYDGPIAIKGVAEDAIVKITDTKGSLLFETEAFGGQAIWDGTQWNGERVASGVYLAWISGRGDFARPSDAVVKIVVIN